MTNAISSKLESIIDSSTVSMSLAEATEDWLVKLQPALAKGSVPWLVLPSGVEQLQRLVKLAAAEQWRILLVGRGTKLGWGQVAQDIKLVIGLQNCDRLIEHAVGDFTVTVEAGMKLRDLQSQLQKHNQFLPLDPARSEGTLGGIVATADAGSWRQRYGGVRDLLLGISFVRADGEAAKAGGRVVKNVAGYDLMKLFTGSFGTLGIITQLTFRTYPIVPTSQTLLLTGEAQAIAQASHRIRNSGLTPVALDLLSTALVEELNLGSGLGLLLRWQTIPASIEQQIQQVQAIAKPAQSKIFVGAEEQALWRDSAQSTAASELAVICKLGIAPSAAVELWQLPIIREQAALGRIHASSGIGELKLSNPQVAVIEEIRAFCQQNQGFLTVHHAPPSLKNQLDLWGYAGDALLIMQKLKAQFDPQNILNPGRFIV